MKRDYTREVEMLEDYGPFIAGKCYKLYGVGFDFLSLRCQGHLYEVPSKLTKGRQPWGVDADKRKRKPKTKGKFEKPSPNRNRQNNQKST